MDKYLEERIRAAFPSGTTFERDDSQIDIGDYKERLRCFLREVTSKLPLQYDVFASDTPLNCYEITFSSSKIPDNWSRVSYDAKVRLLESEKIEDFLYNLNISRIADLYFSNFNHRVPRVDTTYYDFDDKPLDWTWRYYEAVIIESLYRNGFHPANPELMHEKVPFIKVYGGDYIPDDDPRWDDDDFEPEPVIGTVYDCLFRDH